MYGTEANEVRLVLVHIPFKIREVMPMRICVMNAASQNLFLPPPALDLSRVRYLPATERHQIRAAAPQVLYNQICSIAIAAALQCSLTRRHFFSPSSKRRRRRRCRRRERRRRNLLISLIGGDACGGRGTPTHSPSHPLPLYPHSHKTSPQSGTFAPSLAAL